MYKSIFDVKPKAEKKEYVCNRIIDLIDEIKYEIGNYIARGKTVINYLFRKSELNNGYSSIDDLLIANGIVSIWDFIEEELDEDEISDNDIMVNLEIIINCLLKVDSSKMHSGMEIITLINKAACNYLLSLGYKIKSNKEEGKAYIILNDTCVDVDNIADIQLKDDVITYYDYKNVFNKVEKRRIIVDLINILEPKKDLIKKILGNKVEDLYRFYANNIQLRHNNTDPAVKSYYNKSIADLTDEELVEWYDFIFAFNFNIYVNINKLKNININEGCK